MTSLSVNPDDPQPTTDVVPRQELLRDATAELLDAVSAFVARYVVLPGEEALNSVALWIMHTWVADIVDCTPYLMILSSEPGSGKSRLLETLSYVVRNPWMTAQTTPTVLFRRMATDKPTLLLDELDTIFRGGSSNEALRAVLNSGNRSSGTVDRCDGKWGTISYPTYGPKALCGIDNGFLPDTIVDRSITIRMRKERGQTARLRPRIAAVEAAPIAYTLDAWASTVKEELALLQPALPRALSDRACDAWEPLLGIAEFAGHGWPERTLKAALALNKPPEQQNTPVVEAAAEPVPLLPAMQAALATPQQAVEARI